MKLSKPFSALRRPWRWGGASQYLQIQQRASELAQHRREGWEAGFKFAASLVAPSIIVMKHGENTEVVQDLLEKRTGGIFVTTPSNARKMNMSAQLDQLWEEKYGD